MENKEMKMKINWVLYPAVSANRDFYVANIHGEKICIVYGINKNQRGWLCKINNIVVHIAQTNKSGKAYFAHRFLSNVDQYQI